MRQVPTPQVCNPYAVPEPSAVPRAAPMGPPCLRCGHAAGKGVYAAAGAQVSGRRLVVFVARGGVLDLFLRGFWVRGTAFARIRPYTSV